MIRAGALLLGIPVRFPMRPLCLPFHVAVFGRSAVRVQYLLKTFRAPWYKYRVGVAADLALFNNPRRPLGLATQRRGVGGKSRI